MRAVLTIIIVSHNTKRELGDCLRSLHEHPAQTPHEIVVVDNASRDGSVEMVRIEWPHVHLIGLPDNVGFAKANNAGVRDTSGELVLFLNSDTLVARGAIDRMVAELKSLPGAAALGPRLVDGTGRAELSFGRMMGPFAELRQRLILGIGGAGTIERMTSRVRQVDWVSAACLLVRRDAALEAGLFDERYFMYCEDVDFCAALRSRGGHVYFTPAAVVTHLRGRSGQTNQSATDQAYRRSQLAFYQKHHPAWAPLLRLYLASRGKLPP